MNQASEEKLVKDYTTKADEIIKRMYLIVARAQRKQDDRVYRKILGSLSK